MDYIETPRKAPKKAPKKAKAKIKTIEKEKIDMDKQTFIKAKAEHKDKIAKIKAQRKQLKSDIVRHKLLIKQAKLAYKLSQMKEK